MTDKIQQARRELFEAWAPYRTDLNGDGFYASSHTRAQWSAFNAALDCVVLDLPPAFEDVHNYACYQGGWNDMRRESVDAIESTNLGIKVK